MALTKAQVKEILSKAGVNPESMNEAVERILNGHITSIEALREERDKYKVDSEKYAETAKELEELKKNSGDIGDLQAKYDELKKEYESYKSDVKAKETKATKERAYRELLIESGISEKRVGAILRVTDLSTIEISEDGKLKDSKKLASNIKEEWADFIATKSKEGANVPTPPSNSGGTFEQMTLSEKMEYANANPNSKEVMEWLKK